MSLEVVNLSHIFLDATKLVFLLHKRDSFEISTIRPMLVLISRQVNCMTERVSIHGINTSQYVVNQMRSERVVAVLSVHFNYAEVMFVHAINIEHASALLICVVSVQVQLMFSDVALRTLHE